MVVERTVSKAKGASDQAGNRGWVRVSRARPCPICAKPDYCRVTADGALAHCMRVSEGGRPWPGSAGGSLHRLVDSPAVGYAVVEPRRRPPAEPLPPERHDRIARELLRLLQLSPQHRAQLEARGLDAAAIERQLYRTWPLKGRAEVARLLLERGLLEEDLARFPGFLWKEGRFGSYPTLAGAPGLLIPVVNAAGLIVGLRIRPDLVGVGGKYKWLSSRTQNHPDGASPGTPIHVARPSVLSEPATAWITEGEIKANIASERLGAIVLSLPGVSSRAGVVDVLRAVGAQCVIVAFDADKGTKPLVAAAELALARDLRAAGLEVQEARWPADQAKGLDDLLVAGGKPEVVPFRFPRESRVETVSREWLAANLPPAPPLIPLADARARLSADVRSLLAAAVPGLTLIEASPGVGKTVSALIEVQTAIAAGSLGSRRVLFLADNHAQVAELLANTLLADLAKVARVRYGRTDDVASPGFCADRKEGKGVASILGRQRQSVAGSYCSASGGGDRCPFASRCAGAGYLAQLAEAKEAPVVFATKGLFASDPAELDAFDVIIVDEDLARGLFERVRITRQDVDDWRAAVARTGAPASRAGEWHAILHEVLVNGLPAAGWEARPFVPALIDAARRLGHDLDQVVSRVAALGADAQGRLPFERPIVEGGKWTVPLRATTDLIEAVAEELARRAEMGEGTPSRMRLTADGLELLLPRRRHIEALAGKTVINLDATPCLPLLSLLFPSLRRVTLSVPEQVEVTQVTNALYTPSHVARDLPRLSQLIDMIAKDEPAPVIFSSKRFDPGKSEAAEVLSVSNPRARFGHFDGESRGLDRYSDASLLVVVGHYVHNVGDLEALVQAARAAARPVPRSLADEVLLPYRWTGSDGAGQARWVRRHADPDVAALVEWSRTSNILQTIGRGRAALRTEGDPLRVILLAAHPIPGLPVSRLVTVRQLEEEAGLRGPKVPTAADPLAAANARREGDLDAQVRQAAEAIEGRGEEVTPSTVAREMGEGRAGGSRRGRIAEHLAGMQVPYHPPLSRPSCSVLSKEHGGDTPFDWKERSSPARQGCRPSRGSDPWTWGGPDRVRGSGFGMFARTWRGPPAGSSFASRNSVNSSVGSDLEIVRNEAHVEALS